MAVCVLVAVVLALLSEMPWIGRPIRAHILQALIVCFFVFVAGFGKSQEDLKTALLRGPAPWALALVAWCAFETALPPTRAFAFSRLVQPFAIPELLRMAFCVGLFLCAAYGLRGSDLQPVGVGVAVLGALVALYGLEEYGSHGRAVWELRSIFGNHEQVGSFLMLMLPLPAVFAIDRRGDQRLMMGAQAVSVILAGAILLTRTRSAWIGEAAGLATLSALFLKYNPMRFDRNERGALVGPILILGIGLAMLLFSSQLAPLLSQRSGTLLHALEDTSFTDRLHRWRAACRMAYEMPWTGWGPGSYPVLEKRWTGTGDDAVLVVLRGTGHSNIAHNFWVQWTAETGGVGVFLYVAAVVAFLLCVGKALPSISSGLRRNIAIGCVAAAVAACVDMVGAPSYSFPGVSSLPWLYMGMAVAACRPEKKAAAGSAALPATAPWIRAVSAASGVAVALAIIAIGAHQPAPHSRSGTAAAPAP